MNLRNIFIKASTAIAMAGLTVTAANAIDLTATATATVVEPLAITQVTPMDFGTISGTLTAGTVRLAVDNSRSVLGGAQTLINDGAAGDYTITGEPGLLFDLSFANGTLTGPGADMIVSNFQTSLGAPPLTSNLDAAGPTAGEANFQVGADLAVGSNQVSGDYNGTFTITVNYN
ncbi:MAG: DUF4402 domain-containing protein [Gammaproteobacteria bacterium]|nr:MAG: DUF4402 domain-containing protein [Gammaproteobacteria bacterium]